MLKAATQTHFCQCTVDFQGKFCERRELKGVFNPVLVLDEYIVSS